jgi:hypothetical protein
MRTFNEIKINIISDSVQCICSATTEAVTKLHTLRSQKNCCNVATQTAEPRRVKTAHNSQRSKANNAVLLT